MIFEIELFSHDALNITRLSKREWIRHRLISLGQQVTNT